MLIGGRRLTCGLRAWSEYFGTHDMAYAVRVLSALWQRGDWHGRCVVRGLSIADKSADQGSEYNCPQGESMTSRRAVKVKADRGGGLALR